MPLPLTVSCFSEIQIGFISLVPAHPGSPGQRAVKWVYVCVCVCVSVLFSGSQLLSGRIAIMLMLSRVVHNAFHNIMQPQSADVQ